MAHALMVSRDRVVRIGIGLGRGHYWVRGQGSDWGQKIGVSMMGVRGLGWGWLGALRRYHSEPAGIVQCFEHIPHHTRRCHPKMPILTESRSNQRDQGPGGGTTRAMVGSPPRMPVLSSMAVSHCALREERPPLTPPGGVGFASSDLRRRCAVAGRAAGRGIYILGVHACNKQGRQQVY